MCVTDANGTQLCGLTTSHEMYVHRSVMYIMFITQCMYVCMYVCNGVWQGYCTQVIGIINSCIFAESADFI